VVRAKKKTTNKLKTKKHLAKRVEKKAVKAHHASSSSVKKVENVVTIDRRTSDRRKSNPPPTVKERIPLERRAKVNRRRQIDPTTCERDYSLEEIEFMKALDDYKRANGRMFPTCSEVLEVIHMLGYEKRPAPAQVSLVETPTVEAPNQLAAV
jgi:hypothetical protein